MTSCDYCGGCDECCPLDPADAAPLFGCACENPLSVGTVCENCIEIMRDREQQERDDEFADTVRP